MGGKLYLVLDELKEEKAMCFSNIGQQKLNCYLSSLGNSTSTKGRIIQRFRGGVQRLGDYKRGFMSFKEQINHHSLELAVIPI